VSYAVTLAGLPVGDISGSLTFTDSQYRFAATGTTSGLLRLISHSHGDIEVSGNRTRGDLLPSNYSLKTVIRGHEETVRTEFVGRNAAEVSIDPTPAPNGALLPITDAHRKSVVDPLTAAFVGVPTGVALTGPEICNRLVPVFDGRVRYDLKLTFRRVTSVNSTTGFNGSATVCGVAFLPIAGHDPNRFLFRYLSEEREIEVWLVLIQGASVLMPYRISLKTPMGTGVLEARSLEATSISGSISKR
jgi:hypothetical protein